MVQPTSADLVFKVERGCDATRQGLGCGCIGTCHELIDVVKAADYYRLLGRFEQATEQACAVGTTAWLCPRCGWGRVGSSYGGRCRNAFSDECQTVGTFSMLERVEIVPRDDAETLAHAVSAALVHGEDSPLATALKVYLSKHPWSDL